MDPHTTVKGEKTSKAKSFRNNLTNAGNNFLDKFEKYANDRSSENLSYVGRSAYSSSGKACNAASQVMEHHQWDLFSHFENSLVKSDQK